MIQGIYCPVCLLVATCLDFSWLLGSDAHPEGCPLATWQWKSTLAHLHINLPIKEVWISHFRVRLPEDL